MTTKKKPMTRRGKTPVESVIPCLAFIDRAEEAVNFYVSVFENSRIVSLVRSEAEGPIPKGKVVQATFELNGREFTAFDGGPHFTPSQAFSIVASCKTQKELDDVWSKLSEGGEEGPCGWLTDRFGISWQVLPTSLGEMLEHPESGNSQAVVDAFLKMGKLDIATLERAYARGRPKGAGAAGKKITFERTFRAPVEDVWDLWTTRAGLESWWGPGGFTTKVRKFDVRPGGGFEYAMTATDPTQVAAMKEMGLPLTSVLHGTYTEVTPRRRMVYNQVVDFIEGVAPYEVTTVVEFRAGPRGIVRMVVTEDAMHDDHWTQLSRMGMDSTLDRLEKIVAGKRNR